MSNANQITDTIRTTISNFSTVCNAAGIRRPAKLESRLCEAAEGGTDAARVLRDALRWVLVVRRVSFRRVDTLDCWARALVDAYRIAR